jgi:hypothetical protein
MNRDESAMTMQHKQIMREKEMREREIEHSKDRQMKYVNEMLEISAETNNTLSSQNQQLERIDGMLSDIENDTRRANIVLNKIGRKCPCCCKCYYRLISWCFLKCCKCCKCCDDGSQMFSQTSTHNGIIMIQPQETHEAISVRGNTASKGCTVTIDPTLPDAEHLEKISTAIGNIKNAAITMSSLLDESIELTDRITNRTINQETRVNYLAQKTASLI